MNEILNYSPETQYRDFPPDSLSDLSEIVGINGESIEKTTLNLPDIIPAIPTLYNIDGSIDYIELEKMLTKQKQAGIQAVLIAGTTGESSFLDHKEQVEYVKKAVEIAKKLGLQVLAGSGSNSTSEQNQLTSGVFEAGADASLLLAPYYIKASNTDIVRHLTNGLNYGPAIIYSISGRTGVPINSEVLEILSAHPNFLGVKECDGPEKINDLVRRGIRVWTGNDDTSFRDIHKFGAEGTISVVCNIDPELMLEIREGINLTKTQINRLLDLSHLMFLPGQPNPKSIHNVMEMIRRGVDENLNTPATFRLPLGPLSIPQQLYAKKFLNQLGIQSRPFYDNYNLIG